MLKAVAKHFPQFAKKARRHDLENVLDPATVTEVEALEKQLGILLPESYKALLRCARGFWLMGGVVQFGPQHPFVHEYPPLESLNPAQRRMVDLKGGPWPPASQGMLCFAEFFMEANGDQVLFATKNGLNKGEYPIMYWAHDDRPPSLRRLATSFTEFMEGFLDYPGFEQEDED